MIARLRDVVRAGCELVQPANTPDRPAIPAALRASDFESDRLALAGSIVEFTAPAGTKSYHAVPFDPVSGSKVFTSTTGDPALVAARNVAYFAAAATQATAVAMGVLTFPEGGGARASSFLLGSETIKIEPVVRPAGLQQVRVTIGLGSAEVRDIGDLEAILGPTTWRPWAGDPGGPEPIPARAGVPAADAARSTDTAVESLFGSGLVAGAQLHGSTAVGNAEGADLETLCHGWCQPATFR